MNIGFAKKASQVVYIKMEFAMLANNYLIMMRNIKFVELEVVKITEEINVVDANILSKNN